MDRGLLAYGVLGGALVPVSIGPQTLAYLESASVTFAGTPCWPAVQDCQCCESALVTLEPPGGWTDPASDYIAGPAYVPWVTADNPYSADFLGFMWEGGDGFEGTIATRDVVDSTRAGGIATRQRLGARQATARLSAYATSQAGMEAGRRWLDFVLRGGCIDEGCEESTLLACSWLTFCPNAADECGLHAAFREMVDTTVIAGPTWTPDAECPDQVATVEFTIASRSPYLYGSTLFDECRTPCVASPDTETTIAHAPGHSRHSYVTHEVIDAAPTSGVDVWGIAAAAHYPFSTYPEWEDPDDLSTRKVSGVWAVGAGFDTPGAECTPTRASVVFTITYASRAGGADAEFSIGLMDSTTGLRLPGFASGGNQVAGYPNAGNYRATPGTTQRVAYTTEVPASAIDGGAQPTFVARSSTNDETPSVSDEFTIDSIELWVEWDCAAGLGACECHFPHDFCHHPYQVCAVDGPTFADAVPIISIAGTGGRGMRLEVLHDRAGTALTCEDETAPVGPLRTESALVYDAPDSVATYATLQSIFTALPDQADGTGAGSTFPLVYFGAAGTAIDSWVLAGWTFSGLLTPPADLDPLPASVDDLVSVDIYAHVRYTPLTDVAGQNPGTDYASSAIGVAVYGSTDVALPAGNLVGANGSNGIPYTAWDGYYRGDGEQRELVLHLDRPDLLVAGGMDDATIAIAMRQNGGEGLDADEVRIDGVWFEVRWRAHYADPDAAQCADGAEACAVYNIHGADIEGTIDGRTGRFDLGDAIVESDGGGPPRPLDACCGDLCVRWAWLPGDTEIDGASVTVDWVPRYTG